MEEYKTFVMYQTKNGKIFNRKYTRDLKHSWITIRATEYQLQANRTSIIELNKYFYTALKKLIKEKGKEENETLSF